MLATVTRRSLALALGCAPARRLAAAVLPPLLPSSPQGRRRRAASALAAAAATGKDGTTGDDDEKPVRLDKLLSGLGYGSRREVAALIRAGRVAVLGADEGAGGGGKKKCKQAPRLAADSRTLPSTVRLDGEPLDPRPPLTLLLNKPEGYVVASPDDPRAGGPTVYDLLPERFGARKPFLGPAGRLDKATSGLVLLTDDGGLAHRIMSPKKVLWKEYEATLDAPMSEEELADAARLFASGELVLSGDDGSPSAGRPLLPAKISSPAAAGSGGGATSVVRVRVCEGRYHQVRRMMRAVGREVVALRRLSIGGLALAPPPAAPPPDGGGDAGGAGGQEAAGAVVRLAPGEWCAATAADLAALFWGGARVDEEEEAGEEDDEEEQQGRHDDDDAEGEAPRTAVAAAAAAPALRGRDDEEEAEMHRRARVDARRRDKRRAARDDVVAR